MDWTIKSFFNTNNYLSSIVLVGDALAALALLICGILLMTATDAKKQVIVKNTMKKILAAFVAVTLFGLIISAVTTLSGGTGVDKTISIKYV